MRKYQEHFRKANSIAKQAFAEYRKAEKAWKNAEEQAKRYPDGRIGVTVDAEYLAKAARAKADLMEARQNMDKAKRTMASYKDEFGRIRQSLAADIAAANAANASDVDIATLELLKSGILTGAEYMSLLQNANPTMTRIIGKYAHDAAEARGKYGPGDEEAKALRIAEYQSRTNTGEEVLQSFDVLQDAFSRSVNNSSMIDHWDALTGEIVQAYTGDVPAAAE